MLRNTPLYNLDDIHEKVEKGDVRITKRIRQFVRNRYDGEDPTDVVCEVVRAIEEKNYYKTDELAVKPGMFADIYRNIYCKEYPEEDWYVKLFVVDGEAVVDIFSCNWEGYSH